MKFNIIQHVYNHADRFFFIEGNTAKNIYTPNQVKEAENRGVAGIMQMRKVKGEVNNAFRHSNCSAMYD